MYLLHLKSGDYIGKLFSMTLNVHLNDKYMDIVHILCFSIGDLLLR